MSRKHCTKHPDRGRSNYPERLAARGLGKTPAMADLATLRYRQQRRIEQTGHPFPTATEVLEAA